MWVNPSYNTLYKLYIISLRLVSILKTYCIPPTIDRCNSVLCRLPATEIHKLQQVYYTAAIRLIVRIKQRNNITPVLKHFHWFPVRPGVT